MKTFTQNYVDLTRDAGFKAVLGSQSNKDLLIGILNYILPPERRVGDIVQYMDKEQLPSIVSSKISYFDLTCKGEDGCVFIIEMQNHRERDFLQRCVYYGAETYSRELSAGDDYGELRPVYVIAFLNFNYPHEDESLWDSDNFIAHYILKENRTNEVAPSTISVNFVELRRFTKDKGECVTERDWLFYLFRAINQFENLGNELDLETFPLIRRMEHACKLAGMTGEQRTKYDSIMRSERDFIARLNSARSEGLTEGMEKGMEKGRAEGERNRDLAIAKSMLSESLPVEQISRLTGLSVEDVENLKSPKNG